MKGFVDRSRQRASASRANSHAFSASGRIISALAGANSDVDLFFDYPKGKFGLYELIDVKDYTASILGAKADIMTRDSLHRMLRKRIEAAALQVF